MGDVKYRGTSAVESGIVERVTGALRKQPPVVVNPRYEVNPMNLADAIRLRPLDTDSEGAERLLMRHALSDVLALAVLRSTPVAVGSAPTLRLDTMRVAA